tara:strand:+ start:1943 stop:2173 length:231 start_codon:yes stop_codon:yes gene_type:complete
MSKDFLKLGDTVSWKGCFGMSDAKDAVVKNICKSAYSGDKHGREVGEVLWTDFVGRDYLVDLDNGNWAWASQISRK